MLIPACTLLFLTLFCSDSTANPPVPTPEVEVDEAGCRLDLSARPARLEIPVINRSDSSIHARLKLEFLSQKEAADAVVEVPGRNNLEFVQPDNGSAIPRFLHLHGTSRGQ